MITQGRRNKSFSTQTKRKLIKFRPCLNALEKRELLAGIINGDFQESDPSSPNFGYVLRGNARVGNGLGILDEGGTIQSQIKQTFSVLPGVTKLQFTIVSDELKPNGGGQPPDAFEVAFLDANGQPLVGPASGLPGTDAFLNIQETGQVYYAPGVSVPGAGSSGQVATLTFPLVVTVDMAGIAQNTTGTIYFDLVGFNPATSSISIDNLIAFGPTAPPTVSLYLNQASDSGIKGDNLTNINPIIVNGLTNPNQEVQVDINNDGVFDKTTTSNAQGEFLFSGVVIQEGLNTLVAKASNSGGEAKSTLKVTLDTVKPTGVMTTPLSGSTISTNPGYIEVKWEKNGPAVIDTATYGIGNLMVSGVNITSFLNLGNGLVKYNYSGELQAGLVKVTLVAGQVGDTAGNFNSESVQSFNYKVDPVTVPIATDDSYTTYENTQLKIADPGVLGNDTNPVVGSTLTAQLISGPLHGILSLLTDGSFQYSPKQGYTGEDQFVYSASNGVAISNNATVKIEVNKLNPTSPPVANDDYFSGSAGKPLIVLAPGVLENDVSPNPSSQLTAVIVAQPSKGILTMNADGSFQYKPEPGYCGIDTFKYQAKSGQLSSNTATVQIQLNPVKPDISGLPRIIQRLFARRELNPTRFDHYHPRIGPMLKALETGIQPNSRFYNAATARRNINPTRFDKYHPRLGPWLALLNTLCK